MIPRGLLIALFVLTVPPKELTPTRSVRHVESLTYPTLALQARVEGEVKLDVVVGPDGNVLEADTQRGNPLLVPAADANIRKWEFSAGEEERTEIVYKFVLRDPPVETRADTECTFDLPSAVTVVSQRLEPIIDVGPIGKHRH